MSLVKASQLDVSPPEWLVDGMIPRTGFGFLHGPTNVGKSAVACTELALAIANGQPFLGRAVTGGSVILALGEGAYDAGLRKQARIERQLAESGPQPYTDERLWVYPEPFTVPAIRNPFGLVGFEAGYNQALARFLTVEELELVIIDALQDFMGAAAVTNDAAANRFVLGVKNLAEKLDCVVLVIAHNTADNARMRGAQRLQDAADFRIEAVRWDPLPGELPGAVLTCAKTKYGQPFDPAGYQVEPTVWNSPLLDDAGNPTGETRPVSTVTVRGWNPDEITAPAPRRERKRTGLLRRRKEEAA